MARQKPILTHSRNARAIAKADAPADVKRAALGKYAEAVRAARGDGDKRGTPGLTMNRLSNSRPDVRDAQLGQRIDNARASQQAQLRHRVFEARRDALAPRKTQRSIGRERTSPVGFRGQPTAVPSARVDALKQYRTLGRDMDARKVRPFPTRGG